ncbi:MAG: hypothetical protein ACYC23_19295 [Limisphaerales bacterium]
MVRPLGPVTLREVLLREWEIVRVVREGARSFHPLVVKPGRLLTALDDKQRGRSTASWLPRMR